ncbi:hypothetical protein JNW91_21490 [Micromonospora sp. STR1_7]|uniref:Uncharacterized protein n=1 Tax=Micromonospora parastrephiae TaxID=2806101 RepID=A0ABS1XY39_9ACTN|nr:hypothetical protein [Micromonospora parastrephiae]MBM0234190.1 hypothetical protein [Micromonospora parastrephiae]
MTARRDAAAAPFVAVLPANVQMALRVARTSGRAAGDAHWITWRSLSPHRPRWSA